MFDGQRRSLPDFQLSVAAHLRKSGTLCIISSKTKHTPSPLHIFRCIHRRCTPLHYNLVATSYIRRCRYGLIARGPAHPRPPRSSANLPRPPANIGLPLHSTIAPEIYPDVHAMQPRQKRTVCLNTSYLIPPHTALAGGCDSLASPPRFMCY